MVHRQRSIIYISCQSQFLNFITKPLHYTTQCLTTLQSPTLALDLSLAAVRSPIARFRTCFLTATPISPLALDLSSVTRSQTTRFTASFPTAPQSPTPRTHLSQTRKSPRTLSRRTPSPTASLTCLRRTSPSPRTACSLETSNRVST